MSRIHCLTLFVLLIQGEIILADEAMMDVRVTGLDGKRIQGELVSLSRDRCVVKTENGEKTISIVEILTMERESAVEGQSELTDLVEMTNGDRVRGSIIEMIDEQLRLSRNPGRKPITIPLEFIRWFMDNPSRHRSSREKILRELARPLEGHDRLLTGHGETMPMRLVEITGQSIGFEIASESQSRQRDGCIAIRFDDQLSLPPQTDRRTVHTFVLLSGEILTGRFDQVGDASIGIHPPWGDPIEVHRRDIQRIEFDAASTRPLVELEPLKIVAREFFERTEDSAPGFEQDRNALGLPMMTRGRFYPRGIGVTSGTELTFAIGGSEAFVTEVAVDDAGGELGGVVFEVLVDEELAWTSGEMDRLDGVKSTGLLELGDAETLTLKVAFGKRADVKDYANWINPRFLKTRAE